MIGEVATREELLILLSAAARTGSVSAARILLEELRRDGVDEPAFASVIDELATRRRETAVVGQFD